MDKNEELNDVAQALRSIASLCRHGILSPEPHDFDDYAERLEKLAARKKYVYVLTEIDKTNFPCTEPQDVSNWVFGTAKEARNKMKILFNAMKYNSTHPFENEEIREWDAFKNSDDYEIIWVIRKVPFNEG